MPYRVCVSERFIRPLPPRIRGCIRSELKHVAEMAERLPRTSVRSEALPVRALPDGYWMSYCLDERARTVRLMVIAEPKKGGAAARPSATPYSAPMNG